MPPSASTAAPARPAPPARQPAPESLLEVQGVRQTYARGTGSDLLVLDGVDLTLRSGEIVGLLGRSGSGKSSLLRIIAGLIAPAGGEVRWRGRPLKGPCEGIAMVFQSFALFPWLTVQQNVELGLEPLGVPPAERRSRSLHAIDLIGAGTASRTPTPRSCPAACASASASPAASSCSPSCC